MKLPILQQRQRLPTLLLRACLNPLHHHPTTVFSKDPEVRFRNHKEWANGKGETADQRASQAARGVHTCKVLCTPTACKRQSTGKLASTVDIRAAIFKLQTHVFHLTYKFSPVSLFDSVTTDSPHAVGKLQGQSQGSSGISRAEHEAMHPCWPRRNGLSSCLTCPFYLKIRARHAMNTRVVQRLLLAIAACVRAASIIRLQFFCGIAIRLLFRADYAAKRA